MCSFCYFSVIQFIQKPMLQGKISMFDIPFILFYYVLMKTLYTDLERVGKGVRLVHINAASLL